MAYYFIAGFFFFGIFCAFLSSILSHLSQEKLNSIPEFESSATRQLHLLKEKSDIVTTSLLILENFAYLNIIPFIMGLFLFKFDYYFEFFITFLITFNIILLSRTITSAFGKKYSDILAFKMIHIVYILYLIPGPLVKFLKMTDLKIRGKQDDEASREELSAMVETAHEDGSIEADEYRILKNIIHFSDVLVSDVMTPRTVVFSCKSDTTVEAVLNMQEIKMYSRFPVYEGESLDKGVTGYVMTKDVLLAGISGKKDRKIKEFVRDVYYIPENSELDNALNRFLERRQHLFIVVDEYGGVEGLLTMEDVLETILGVEIVDEADKVVDLREMAKIRRDKRIALISDHEQISFS